MLRTLVPARKVVVPHEGLRLIVNLSIISIAFATVTLAMLLAILFDLAPRTGLTADREYEAVRIVVELVVLLFSAGLTLWVLLFRAVR
jgi:hypothetical protein